MTQQHVVNTVYLTEYYESKDCDTMSTDNTGCHFSDRQQTTDTSKKTEQKIFVIT